MIEVSGPSRSWYAVSGAGILVAVVVLLFSGVYWPLLFAPVAAFALWKAWRGGRKHRGSL
jgi:hypothetical protein